MSIPEVPDHQPVMGSMQFLDAVNHQIERASHYTVGLNNNRSHIQAAEAAWKTYCLLNGLPHQTIYS